MDRVLQAVRKNADLVAAFAAPVVILAVVYALYGVYPFGERTVISSDFAHQYLPIMAELQRSIGEPSGLFYTFNAGLGTDFYALSTYQNASPITWLFLALFPADKLVLCATFMIMVKLGLISCAMCWYLKRLTASTGQALGAPVRIALSLFYALGGYALAYCGHIMWLDTLILLPFVVWGLRRIVEGGSSTLYLVSLALMLFANYYTALMACVFLVLYFFVHTFSERTQQMPRLLVRVGAVSLLAGAMAAIVLFPTFFTLLQTGNYATLGEGQSGLLYNRVPDHITQLLPASPLTMLEGPPNLYAGLATIVLLVLFAFNAGIDRRKRIAKSIFILFLFISTNVVSIDMLWHLLHAPNMLPARYAFVLSFMLLEIAAESLTHIKTAKTSSILVAFACVGVLYFVAIVGGTRQMDWLFMLFCGVALLVLYGFVLVVMRSNDGSVRTQLLAMVMAFEVVLVAFHGIGASEIVQEDGFLPHGDSVAELLEIVEQEDSFARVEILGSGNLNAPLAYGYKGTSVFASSVSENTFKVLNGLFTNGAPQTNKFTYSEIGSVSDAITNIGYYISLDEPCDEPWLTELAKVNNCYLYESAYRTSIGYLLPESIAAWSLDAPRAEVLNSFVTLATKGKVEDQAASEQIVQSSGEVDLDAWDKAFPHIFTDLLQVSDMQGNRLAGIIHASADGVFMTTIPYSSGWHVKVDEKTLVEINTVQGFISFPLTAGEHAIEMVYVPQGFALGAILSLLGVAVSIAFFALRRKRSKPPL